MESEQSNAQTIMQAVFEPAKAATMAVREAEDPTKSRRPVHEVPRTNGSALRKPTFNWKAQDKYNKLHNFKTEVREKFMMNSY